MSEPRRHRLGGDTIEDQPQGEKVGQFRRHRPDRSPVGAGLELPDHPGPATQRQQGAENEVVLLGGGNPQQVDLGGDHLMRRATAHCNQGSGQMPAPGLGRSERLTVEVGDGRQQSLLPTRHGPRRHSLIEKCGTDPDEERMNQGVGVDRRNDGENEITQPDRGLNMGHRWPREDDRLDAGMPEIVGRRVLADVGMLRQGPADGVVILLPEGKLQKCQTERPQRHPPPREPFAAGLPQVGIEHRLDVSRSYPPPLHLCPVVGLGEERFGAVEARGPHHGVLEWLPLESLKDVLGHEDADRTL